MRELTRQELQAVSGGFVEKLPPPGMTRHPIRDLVVSILRAIFRPVRAPGPVPGPTR